MPWQNNENEILWIHCLNSKVVRDFLASLGKSGIHPLCERLCGGSYQLRRRQRGDAVHLCDDLQVTARERHVERVPDSEEPNPVTQHIPDLSRTCLTMH